MTTRRFFISSVISLSIAFLLSACGSSDTSTSGGAGASFNSASISGNVNSGLGYIDDQSNSMISKLYRTVLPEAQASGVSGVTVELLLAGAIVDSKVTDGSGNFRFDNLVAGNYTLRLMQNGASIGSSPIISLADNTETTLELNLDGSIMESKVVAGTNSISGEIEDDFSNDDAVSEDDDSSEDDISEDGESDDDDSSEDGVSDDDSDDS